MPPEGAPSIEWLAGFLAAERTSMVQDLEQHLQQRHQSLLLDIQAKMSAGKGDVLARSLDAAGQVAGKPPAPLGSPAAAPPGGGDAREEAPGGEAAQQTPPPLKLPSPTTPCSVAPPPPAEKRRQSDVSVAQAPTMFAPPPLLEQRRQSGTQSATSSCFSATKTILGAPPAGDPRRGSDTSARASERLFSLQEDTSRPGRMLLKLVQSSRFEIAIACITMGYAVIMALQIQYQGIGVGHDLKYNGYDERKEEVWRGGETGLAVMEYIFGVIFTIELVIKIVALRSAWLRDAWNYLDAVIVCMWLVETVFQGSLDLPENATVLRLARLFRVLRLLKVLRTLQGFHALYFLLTTLKGSLAALAWSCVPLFVTQMLIAMVFWFVLKEAYFDDDYFPIHERQEVFEYFGTFTRSMLTMFEMTLANWPPVCRLLSENVNEWFALFCILHKLTMGFAVIGVINGVFMQETFKVAATDDRSMLRQREREVKTQSSKLRRLFEAADDSGDGVVDRFEFAQIMQDREILLWLSSMEITVSDPDRLYTLLDTNGDERLTCEEFVRGALRMRGGAKNVDVLEMKKQVGQIWSQLFPDTKPLRTPKVQRDRASLRSSLRSSLSGEDPAGHPFEVRKSLSGS